MPSTTGWPEVYELHVTNGRGKEDSDDDTTHANSSRRHAEERKETAAPRRQVSLEPIGAYQSEYMGINIKGALVHAGGQGGVEALSQTFSYGEGVGYNRIRWRRLKDLYRTRENKVKGSVHSH
jgi:hypothetical protein